MEIETHPNTNARTYHLSRPISNCSIQMFSYPLQSYDKPKLLEVGRLGAKIVKDTLQVHGVSQVYVHPDSLLVVKGEAFLWEEIEPAITKILHGEQVQVTTTPARIMIENVPNMDVIFFHTSTRISESRIRSCNKQTQTTALGPIEEQIIRNIFQIPNVIEAIIEPYEIHVGKSNAASWEEIKPAIIDLLKKSFSQTDVQVTEMPFDAEKWRHCDDDHDDYDENDDNHRS